MARKADIWMPLYIGDYLAATTHLSAEESGAYMHLLMHQWKNGQLPEDTEALRRIARVDKDAWSNAWAVLEQFFDHAKGMPVQLRLERIREEWQGKKDAASAKAKGAADKRWGKDASSNAQAMPQSCPSSSSSPIPNTTTKTTTLTPTATAVVVAPKESKPRKSPNPLHEVFKGLIWHEWAQWGNPIEPPWDGAEGKQLGMFLSRNPKLGVEGFRRLLQYRARSHGVNLAERPCKWIPGLTDYAQGPLNQFKQPEGTNGTNQRGNGKADYAQAELLKSLSADYHAAAGLAQVGAGDDVPQSGGAAGFDPSDELRADDSRTILGR